MCSRSEDLIVGSVFKILVLPDVGELVFCSSIIVRLILLIFWSYSAESYIKRYLVHHVIDNILTCLFRFVVFYVTFCCFLHDVLLFFT